MIQISYTNRVKYTLQHSSTKPYLIVEPDGWETDEKEYARHKDYHGIFTKFSNNLTFKENGAEYINNIRDTYGVNAEIRLIRWERHPRTDVWMRSYDGVLDLSEWSQDGFDVKCKFNSSGLETQLKARHNEKFEIERTTALDGTDIGELPTQIIEQEGKRIFLKSMLEANSEEAVLDEINGREGYRRTHIAYPFSIKSNSDKENIEEPFQFEFGATSVESVPSATSLFYVDNDRDKTLRIYGELSFDISHINMRNWINPFIEIRMVVYSNSENLDYKEDYLIFQEQTPESGLTLSRTASFDNTLEINQGDSIGFIIMIGGTGTNQRGRYQKRFENCQGYLSVEEDSFFEKTSTKLVMAYELGQRLAQIITGRSDAFVSDTLNRTDIGAKQDGECSLKGFASGHWIRGFDSLPNNDENKYKPFQTSWKDYFHDLRVTENQGLDIERVGFREQIRIRNLKDFYAKTVGIRLPNQVGKIKRKELKNKDFSALEFGFEKGWDNEEAMGLDEYNTKSRFVTPITRVSQTLSLVTKYIYATYANEFIRRKQISTHPTEDHTNDKEIFGYSLKRYYNEFKQRVWQDDFQEEPTGIWSADTATNLLYTPMNLLLKHSWYFMTGLTKNLKDKIRFSGSEGNSKLTTQRNGGTKYQEREEGIDVDTLEKPRFVAEQIEFEHRATFDILEELEQDIVYDGVRTKKKYCEIEFINEKGKLEHGFLMSLKPNGSGKWVLIKSYRL